MMAMIELLSLVTLTLTFVSSPSHGSLHRTQQRTASEMLDNDEALQPPANVRELSHEKPLPYRIYEVP